MATNTITLNLINQSNSNTINISWNHILQINNRNPANSETVRDLRLQYTPSVVGWSGSFSEILLNYPLKSGTVTLPKNALLNLRLFLRTTAGETYSNTLLIDTRTQPSAPRNVVAVASGNNIGVSWQAPLSNGGAPLTHMYVEYSYDGGTVWYSKQISYNQTTGPNTYTFTNMTRNNTYIFKVIALNSNGTRSPESNRTTPIYLAPNSGISSFLFDKSTFNSVSQPWRDRLIFAAEEWEKHIKIDPVIAQHLLINNPNYRGIILHSFNTFQQAATENGIRTAYVPLADQPGNAGSGWYVYTTPGLDPYSPKIYPARFSIYANTHTDASFLSDESWKGILIHELGHALGFGFGWHSAVLTSLNKSQAIGGVGEANNRWHLKGTYNDPIANNRQFFVNGQNAYNQMFSPNVNGGPFKRNFMPLMWTADDYTNKIAHWAYSRNPSTNFTNLHPPVPGDVMSYGTYAGISQVQITPVTVGIMIDLGYVPATDSPTIASYKTQIATSSSTGYSRSLTMDDGIDLNHLPDVEESTTPLSTGIIFDRNRPAGIVNYLE